jgi:hypothetical protein
LHANFWVARGVARGLSRRQSWVLVRFLSPARGYPRAVEATARVWLGPASKRATATPKSNLKTIKQVLKCKMGEFVLTWSEQKFVWSTVAPRIAISGKGGLLAPESISKSAMVIMSCQLLFIDFLASFCHPFGPFYQFLYTKNHFGWFRSYMEWI